MSINVILFIRTLALGGLEKSALSMLEMLRQNDISTDLLSVFPPEPSSVLLKARPSTASYLLNLSATRYTAPLLSRLIAEYTLFLSRSQNASKADPVIIISFGTKENLLAITVALFMMTLHKRKVYTIVSERNHPEFKRFTVPVRFLRRLLYPFSDLLHVQTHSARNWFDSLGIINKDKIIVIPNSIETCSVPSETINNKRESTAFNVLLVGNKYFQKGFDFLNEYADEISNIFSIHCPQRSIKFHVYGGVFSQKSTYPFEEVLYCPETIQYHGPQPLSDIYSSTYDCFLLLSRFEGFPNVVLEAMSYGVLPCVYDPGYGIDEVTGKDYPYLFKNLDVDCIARLLVAIAYLSSDKASELNLYLKDRLSLYTTRKVYIGWKTAFQRFVSSSLSN